MRLFFSLIRYSRQVHHLLAPVVVLFIAACGSSGGGGTPPADTTAPTVGVVSPLNAATGVSAGTTITATFSEAMNAATITGTSFTLSNGGSVSGTVGYDVGTMTATFTPGSSLASGTTYTATITTAVTDVAGNPLATNYTWTFTTADTVAPTVSSTSPADTATGVASNTAITATFDEDMLALSIDTSSFTLSDGGSVSGTVGYDVGTKTATFTPDSNLHLGTDFTATLTTAITDLAGNPLASANTWSFTVEGSWGTAGLIETDDTGTAQNAQIAFDTNGNAIAVWEHNDGTRFNIMANRYTKGVGWGTAALIETDDTGAAGSPQIAFDSNGNAIAVWHHSDGTSNNIMANFYTNGVGWGTAGAIDNSAGSAFNPQIKFDSSGNAIAVWQQLNGTRYDVWANRYVSGSGWGTAALIETDDSGHARFPQIAFDGSGNAIAVWQHNDGVLPTPHENIMANRYTSGSGWGTAGLIETDDTGNAQRPQIAFDGSGNAIAVWYHHDATRNNIMANRYVSGTGWGTAGLIETDDNGEAINPDIAMDSSGNAIAVWSHYNSTTTTYNIMSNRYVAGSGWGTAGLIETDNAGSAYFFPQVAIDDKGNAMAVWQQYDGTRDNIWANRYTGASWGTAGLIETDDTGAAYYPQVAFDSSGNAIAVWQHNDGTRYNITANRFE